MQDITDTIIRTAYEKFRITALKPYQLLVIQRIMEQESSFHVRNQIVILPTGTGKSLCFLVPATLCKGITVIVYPLLALMNDQVGKLREAGIECICIRGGQSHKERMDSFRRLGKTAKIVVTTPESLQNPWVISHLRLHRISLLVVDEAHVISQWGKNFRPAYLGLTNVILRLMPHQILAFTATASKETIRDIRTCLFSSRPLIVRGDADRPNIIYGSYPTLNREQGVLDLIRVCRKPALVFCRTRPDTRMLCQFIQMETTGIPLRYYHAGLSREEREKLESWFMNSDDGVLVTTSAFGMGIDKRGVRTVIHHRLPTEIEEYLQESGRAGRDGKLSTAWVVITVSDRVPDPDSPLVPIFTSSNCRRRSLLGALGQEKDECTGCDVCLGKVKKHMDGEWAVKALARAWPFRFNPLMAAYLLCGCRNAKMIQGRIALNPLYGALKGWNPRLLAKTMESLAESESSFPIGCVSFINGGKLLYPSDILLYNLIAVILRRLNDGYSWIIRKTRKLKGSGKKVQ